MAENFVYQLLVGCSSVLKTKRHNSLKVVGIVCDEGGLVHVRCGHRDLVVSRICIQKTKHFIPRHAVSTKHGVKVDVAAGGNLFAREAIDWFVIWDHGLIWELEFLISGPVENVGRATLADEDFLNGIVFNFNSDDHGVILLVVDAVKVVICEDGHIW